MKLIYQLDTPCGATRLAEPGYANWHTGVNRLDNETSKLVVAIKRTSLSAIFQEVVNWSKKALSTNAEMSNSVTVFMLRHQPSTQRKKQTITITKKK